MKNAKGSIFKHKDYGWRISVELGRNPKTGKRQRITRVIRGSKKHAQEVLNTMLAKYSDTDAGGSVCLDTFFNESYIPHCTETLRPVTVEGYKGTYKRYIKQAFGSYQLRAITPAMIETYIYSIEGNKRRLVIFKTLRQVLNRAKRLNMILHNPCDNVEIPKTTPYKPPVLSKDEVKVYLEHFKDTQAEKIVLIAIGAGLRRSEICALKWSDFDGVKITINKAITSVNGKPHLDAPKSQFGVREIFLPSTIAQRLETFRQSDSAPIISDTLGQPMNPDNVSKLYKDVRDTLPEGVQRISLKNLRHTSLTLALEGGADLLAVSRRGGHSSPNITARYYLRPSEEIDLSTAQGLDDLIK